MKKLFLFLGCLTLLTVACQRATATPQSAVQMPLPTVTAVQTLTPAPTLPPTVMPLFFTEQFNTDLEAWASFQTGGTESPTINLENDLLRIDFPSPTTWYYAIHNGHEYSNVLVSAKILGTPTGSLGVICDYSESNGWYEFSLASDGTYSVLFGQWLAQGIARYAPIVTETSEYLQPETLDYEIGLACQENTLLLYINGKLFRKLDVTRYGLTKGRIGINASSFEDVPMTATFDWVTVSEP